jgi:meso-butanediol dehydrogenase/(S,S)-butanediol dehydrogenase/diacetyl reductase
MKRKAKEIAFITGAASGIGHAIAMHLAGRGAHVGLVDRNPIGLSRTSELIRDSAGTCDVLVADVTESESLEQAVRLFGEKHGGIDTVVCAAGIARWGEIHEFPKKQWDEVIAVNLTGPYLTAHYAIPWLLRRAPSTFTVVSSDAGIWGAKAYGGYCASKHGLLGLIKCMALDYGRRGIRSNAVCPSFTDTPMAQAILADAPPTTRDAWERNVPLGRFASPEEVALAVGHLSSMDASYTNGMSYIIDGGTTAGFSQALE